MRIADKHVKGLAENVTPAVDGQLLIYKSSSGMWETIAAGDVPVSAAGVTATTLNAAILEVFGKINGATIPVSVAGVTATTLNAALLEIFNAI